MTRAVTLANLADTNIFTVDGDNDRVGIGSTIPSTKLDVDGTVTATAANISGVVTATSFEGDGSNLTGVSGFATALSTTQSSPLFSIFKTQETLNIAAGTSLSVEVNDTSAGNHAFMREGIVHVATGATFHVGSATTLVTNVLRIF